MAHQGKTLKTIAISQAAGSADLVAAPGVGVKVYVTGIVLTAGAASTVKFTSGTGPTDLTGPLDFAALGGIVIGFDRDAAVLETDLDNQKLAITVAGTGPVHGFLRYYLAAV